jgi:hypothetical protein
MACFFRQARCKRLAINAPIGRGEYPTLSAIFFNGKKKRG